MYHESTAIHYSAYRPKLHEILLAKCLDDKDRFNLGLDIGCGTGRSSIALSKYCDKITAIDPSEEMLAKAEKHSKISYIHMKGNVDIPDESYDIITFAGSLFYCKSQLLYDKIIAHSASGAFIIIYDFNIRIEKIIEKLGIELPQEINNYNHAEDFSGLKTDKLNKIILLTETIYYPINIADLTHFLLSHPSIYQKQAIESEAADVYDYLSMKLANLSKDITSSIQADLYYQKYKVA